MDPARPWLLSPRGSKRHQPHLQFVEDLHVVLLLAQVAGAGAGQLVRSVVPVVVDLQ